MLTQDRDRPDTYVQVVEFPSYEAAMANSDLPETAAFAEQLAKLCDAPPSFRNLDVVREAERLLGGRTLESFIARRERVPASPHRPSRRTSCASPAPTT